MIYITSDSEATRRTEGERDNHPTFNIAASKKDGMGWHKFTALTTESTSLSLDKVDQRQFFGVVAIVLGACQVALTFTLNGSQLLIVGSGGWLLIGIGSSLIRGRRASESEWNEDGKLGRVAIVALTGLSIWVAARTAHLLVLG